MKTLIVVDYQNDFVTGALGSEEAQAIEEAMIRKVSEAVANGERIIFTQDTHYEDYLNTREGRFLPIEHCIDNTWGHEIVSSILEVAGESPTIVRKETFGFDNWAEILGEVEEVELVGVCTDICVISNALIIKALYPEAELTVDSNVCAGLSPEKHANALDVMQSCQINVL